MHKRLLSSHGVKSLKVALRLLEARGITVHACLHGTGVSVEELDLRRMCADHHREATGLTVQPIAQALGDTEASNFTHAFRRGNGVSPQRYRENFRRRGASDAVSSKAMVPDAMERGH